MRTWIRVASAAALISTVTALLIVTPAQAATSVNITLHRTALAVGSAAAGPAQILCLLKIDNAHASSHALGQANIVSHVTCDSGVDNITLTTRLIRAGVTVATNTVSTVVPGQAFLNGQANAPCSNTTWGGTASAVISSAGYTTGSGSVTANVVSVVCP
jgi:hypothetical protein